MTHTGRLDVVNRLSDAHAAEQLRACNASPRWIEQVLAHRPYADLDTVLDVAEHVARDLDWTEVRRALDAHPRIGERAMRRTSAGAATSSSSAPQVAAPRRWWPSWNAGSATTRRASAPR